MITKKMKFMMSGSLVAAFLLSGCSTINAPENGRVASVVPYEANESRTLDILEVERTAAKTKATKNTTYYVKSNVNGRTKAVNGKVKKVYKKNAKITSNRTTKIKGATWVNDKSTGLWISAKLLTKTKPKATAKVAGPKKTVVKKKPVVKKNVNSREAKAQSILARNGCGYTPIIWNDRRIPAGFGAYDFNVGKVLLTSGISNARFDYVVTHECMHKLQLKAFKSDYWGMAARLNKIYGGKNGLEQAADCMTRAKGSKLYRYTKNCSGYRGTAAKMMIQGKRP